MNTILIFLISTLLGIIVFFTMMKNKSKIYALAGVRNFAACNRCNRKLDSVYSRTPHHPGIVCPFCAQTLKHQHEFRVDKFND